MAKPYLDDTLEEVMEILLPIVESEDQQLIAAAFGAMYSATAFLLVNIEAEDARDKLGLMAVGTIARAVAGEYGGAIEKPN